MKRRHRQIAVVIALVIAGAWFRTVMPSRTVYADSSQEEVARFLQHGSFDPQKISEDELYARIQAAYAEETDGDRMQQLGDRLLKLKWWQLWESNFEMAAETTIVGHPLPRYFRPSDNWQWQELPRVKTHYSLPVNGVARHEVKGIFPYILPVNGALIQYVYLPEAQLPDQVMLRIETGYLLGPQFQQQATFVQAHWTKLPEEPFSTENRPRHFWAGVFPAPIPSQDGKWYALSVNLVDLGLCGAERTIRGIEYRVIGGDAWFGPTVIRRPQVEIRGKKPYNTFAVNEAVAFDLTVHNFAPVDTAYTLRLSVSDYNGATLLNTVYHLTMPGKASRHETVIVNPGTKRYLVLEYTLNVGEEPVYHGYSAAAVIAPNRTGRKDHEKFGMLYWDQPGQEMIDLYEQLGVKLIVIFPELSRLHRFDSHKFAIMPMFWFLPERSTQDAARLAQELQPYLDADQHLFSNFWETDLRVPPAIFAPNMSRFAQIIKQRDPQAKVGIGGLAWFNVAYINQVFELLENTLSPKPLVDFLAIMMYNTPAPPEFSGIQEEAEALRTVLQTHDSPDTELWNVEWAYFENLNLDGGHWLNTGVARDLIAPYTIRHHLVGFAAGISRMIPGTNIYEGRTPLAKNYGHSMTLGRSSVIRYDLTPLPLLPAYSVMTRMLEGKKYFGSIGRHPNVFCQVYQAVDDSDSDVSSCQTVVAAWTLSGIEQIALPLAPTQNIPVTLLNMVGDATEQWSYNGSLHFSVSPEPTYILLDKLPAELLTEATELVEENILAPSEKVIDIAPGQASTIHLTYRVSNPGWNAFQGSLQSSTPNWIQVLNKAIYYPDDMHQQLADKILSNRPDASPVEEFWLGREHSVEVAYDLLIPAEMQRSTYYEQMAITKQFAFPLTAALTTEGRTMAQATTLVRVLPPFSMTIRPVLTRQDDLQTPCIRVQMTNNSSVPRQGTLQLKAPTMIQAVPEQMTFALPAGAGQTYTFALSGRTGEAQTYTFETVDTQLNRRTEQVSIAYDQPVRLDHYRRQNGYLFSFGVGEGFVIEALAQDQQGYETRQSRGFAFRPAVKAKTPPVIDGQLDDWIDAAPLFVHPAERLSGLTFFAKDYGGEMQWTGLDDFSAAWQMMWDASFLYLAIKTYDDVIVPQHNLGNFWNGDTVSFQIDPLPNLTDASILPSPGDLWRIHTFDVGFSQNGPRCRRKYATYDAPAGSVNTVHAAIQPVQDGLIYELAIPWEELTPLRPEIGGWMGFSLVFSDDDGAGRELHCNWFGGSGGNGLAREPRLMGDVHFVE